MRILIAAVLAALVLSACGSSSPSPAPESTPTKSNNVSPGFDQYGAPIVKPVPGPVEAKAPVAVPVDETDAAKGAKPLAGGSVVSDNGGAHVVVHPSDPKKPLKCAPEDKATGHCKENPDGTVEFKGP